MVSQDLTPIVIAGPTGSGKSELAMNLAKKHGGEIICADSRQFYKNLNLGTAQPSSEELNAIRHHGYGEVCPSRQRVDAGFFVDFAHQAISEITARNKKPIIVGGTGMYLRALAYGISDVPRSNPEIKLKLLDKASNFGTKFLYQELQKIDPESAQKISPQDQVRIIRALEIYYLTNKKPSSLRNSFVVKNIKLKARWLYINTSVSKLNENLLKRVKFMFSHGLIEETKYLIKTLPEDSFVFKTMGYEEVLNFINNKITFADAINLTHIRHRQYAKRQVTWFKKENFYEPIWLSDGNNF